MFAATIAAAGAFMMTAAVDPSGASALKQRLEAIASSTVLFGHQSVGANVLDGLRALAGAAGVRLNIAEVQGAAELKPGTFGHVYVASNGDPHRKLASFTTALAGGEPEVALVKFCYVDYDADTDAKGLFEAYQRTLRELRAKHPRTTFVHVTAPLQADEGFVKWLVKKVLGKRNGAVATNARREEYNALLRSAFAGEPFFDLARVESTDSSGQLVSASYQGRSVPMLAGEYTDDGGHLNAAGSWSAALELTGVLGDVLLARSTKGAEGSRIGAP